MSVRSMRFSYREKPDCSSAHVQGHFQLTAIIRDENFHSRF